ncbi:hypothetical protein HZU40_31345 [Mycolicibacterium fluoranthenivorans]|uniref:Alpha/beta hydrolase n=1 Tax=Mycolicibacterium fluoranthenivorans TaxID=258505 RepID=A0A7G8PE00_9MYCO|nr:hypothetical protein [Mycolicibacterium fluoranthenivorans]QNJ92566.1 hypothetical protein HZU40_31345 [Mycolicibacterium fluoranthenivorans]
MHGIAQQQLGRHQLEPAWTIAMRDGIERAINSPLANKSVELTIAYYGDLFLPRAKKNKSTDLSNDFTEDNLSDDEQEFLSDAIEEFAETNSQGISNDQKIRIPGTGLLARADKIFGSRATALLYIGELRQVRRYLLEAAITQETERRVSMHVTDETRILIGHSLGSIVAFEYVRKNPDFNIELLLTLGSPLGIRMVRKLMTDPTFAMTGLPPNVGRWVNVYDSADPVACSAPLSALWTEASDFPVNNGSKPHAVQRYLGKKEAGTPIAEVLGFNIQ